MTNSLTSGWVKSFSILHGSFFDPVVSCQHGRESVSELQDTERRNDGGKTREIGDTGSEDEGNGPVNRDECHPQKLSSFVCERWEAEKLDENVVVDD
jgi:hypothetical protein